MSRSRVLGLWSAPDADVGDAEAAIRRIRACDPAGSIRNAVVSLVTLVDDDRRNATAALRATGALGRRVPGRCIVVSTFAARPAGMKASINVSLVERTDTKSVCVEHVRLYVNGGAIANLSSIVEPWILPGLPLAVWLPGRLPRRGEPVVTRANQVIIDSARIGRPLAELDLAGLGELGTTDLAWIRLRPWRLLLADSFQGADISPFALGVEHADITGTRPWSTLLAGWLMSRLELSPANIRLADGDQPKVQIRARHRDRQAELLIEAVDAYEVRVATTVVGNAARRRLVRLPERFLVDDLEDALRSRPGPDATWMRAAVSAIDLLEHQ
ncbi:MAG TPA: glucose-6-phosphate dehydrogenase assembly protein OpcA [Acidimicrobiales bacterium]|nr:glucose-6-phosphate dehydrogenase assembly protein OpcA [Acidimicrobiales bacterium]